MKELGKLLFWVVLAISVGLIAFRGKECLDTIGNENHMYNQEVERIKRVHRRALEE